MKRGYLSLACLAFVLIGAGIVFAQDEVIDDEELEDVEAGNVPGDFGYSFEIWADGIFKCGMFGSKAKCLIVAEERLAEAEELAKRGEIKKIEVAQKNYERFMLKFRERVEDDDSIEDEEELDAFEAELKIEKRMDRHKERMRVFASNLEDANLTDEQVALIEQLIASFGSNVNDAEIKFKERKGGLEIRLKAKYGDDKIDELEGKNWRRRAENEIAKAEKAIENAERLIRRFLEEKKKLGLESDVTFDEPVSNSPPNDVVALASGRNRDGSNSDSGRVDSDDDTDSDDSDFDDEEDEEDEDEEDDIEEFERKFKFRDFEDSLEAELEIAGETDNSFDVEVPRFEGRGVDAARKYLSFAKEHLTIANNLFSEENYRESYAHAKLARKTARRAVSVLDNGLTDDDKRKVRAKIKAEITGRQRVGAAGVEDSG